MTQSEQEVLLARLQQYPVARYPVQHATTQFHLGSVLLHAGDSAAALDALITARNIFSVAGMRLEQAKTTVQLGVALRTAGRLHEAAAAFTAAGTGLGTLDSPTERAAASYNLGLVHQDQGDLQAAHAAWTEARELFLAAHHRAQAAAAARDHGGSLLTAGEAEQAIPLLELAATLAESASDLSGLGAAANVLGLAYLATDEPAAAVAALRRALAAFPRSTRPGDYAMVKANLALAYERAGDVARARLAAGQSVAVANAAPLVRTQAQQVLARLPGPTDGDLLSVLDAEDQEQWAAVIREEVLRVADLPDQTRQTLLRAVFDGLLTRSGASYDVAEALLQVVLELPPRPYDLMVAAIVAAGAGRSEQDSDRLSAVLSSAMARFAMPQWQRLAASLNAAAVEAGLPAQWR